MATTYKPPQDPIWERAKPASLGLDDGRLGEAVAFAEANESPWPRNFYYPDNRYVGIIEWNETGPWSAVTGMVRPRGGPAGIVLKGGRIAAEWGDTHRTDMTFSVAKSYLAILAGLAVADGLIASVDEPIAATVDGPLFESAHNRAVTWRHMLHQSSEWQGEIWGKSDQVDHNRQVAAGGDNSRKGFARALEAPGTFYEYNDVRVNVLAYSLMRRFGRPLPEVLAERIMAPIGATTDWEWHGYANSWVDLGARRMQSVSGGAHWGGGMFIGARDHARVGLLIARGGRWGGHQLLPERWVREMVTPSATNPSYGYLWWLNRGKSRFKAASESCFYAMGAGNNIIWIDPEHDVVAVMRWIHKGAVGGFIERLTKAVI